MSWYRTVPRKQTTNSLFSTPISTVCCHIDDFFHYDLGLKRPTEDQIEAIHYARLSCLIQLLKMLPTLALPIKCIHTTNTEQEMF